MSRDALKATVLEALHRIAPEAELDRLAPAANLRTTLDLDSFDVLQLFVALHRALGVNVPEAEIGPLDTLDRIVDDLARRLEAAGQAAPGGPPPR